MSKIIDIRIGFQIEPRGKGSVRVGQYGSYKDAKTSAFMNEIKRQARLQYKAPPISRGHFLFVETEFAFSRPKRPKYACPYKPDIDNLEKNLYDALTGIVWHDDAFIQGHSNHKTYAPAGNPGFITIWVKSFGHGYAEGD